MFMNIVRFFEFCSNTFILYLSSFFAHVDPSSMIFTHFSPSSRYFFLGAGNGERWRNVANDEEKMGKDRER